jgi:predicted dehydrogenase
VNNAMSHFLMLMLYLSGGELESLAEPVQLSAELYRAQAIESFDTAVLHLTSASGCRLDFYGTHSSRKLHRPTLQIEGSSGRGEWEQDSHAALSRFDGTEWCQAAQAEANTRERMLRAVLALARGQPAFVCSPRQAAAHVRCVEALHRSVSITPLDPASLDHHQDPAGVDQFTFVPDIEAALRAGADRGLHLHALGVSWAVPPSAATLP